jgi:hypothetical protein
LEVLAASAALEVLAAPEVLAASVVQGVLAA